MGTVEIGAPTIPLESSCPGVILSEAKEPSPEAWPFASLRVIHARHYDGAGGRFV